MKIELKKRILTSFVLISILIFMYLYTYVMIISLILISLISWIEFYGIISKIYFKKKILDRILRLLFKSLSLLYLSSIIFIILLIETEAPYMKIYLVYSILIAIASDVGGLVVGRFFKGKKLTKISPKKTISGSIGSFVFSLFLIPFFSQIITEKGLLILSMITVLISLTTQLGDLSISFLKRKANIKNTSDLLPGHGGFLDRIDGIIFAIPLGLLLFNIF
jgi:phosphatidate cytidylyltransferase